MRTKKLTVQAAANSVGKPIKENPTPTLIKKPFGFRNWVVRWNKEK